MSAQSNRKRLGRGLEALLGPTTPTTEQARKEGTLRELPLDAIRPNPFQPRRQFDGDALNELERSLDASGLLQPVVVRPKGDAEFELIAGERRWRAAQNLGWGRIGAVVRDVDDRTLLTLALVENLQRDQLSPIDEARGYARLISDFGLTQVEVGEMVGRNRATVANALRLLKLPEPVQQMLHDGKLSTGHARALLQLEDPARILEAAARVISDRVSVRELESVTRGPRVPASRPRRRTSRPQSPEVRRVEDALRDHLKTDVFVSSRGNSGKVTIKFYSNDDLARLLELILGESFEG